MNPLLQVKYLFGKQSSLPPKFRFKSTDTLNIIGLVIQSIQPTIEHSHDFLLLSKDARRALIRHNLIGVGTIHGWFATNEINVISDPILVSTCNELYGSDYLTEILSIYSRLETNLTIVKIMIFVLIFSSNLSIVTFENEKNIIMISNSIKFVKIQDIYITVLWKYLIYQYGFIEAVRRFNGLIKTTLDIFHVMNNLSKIKQHNQMLNTIIKEIEYSLKD
jgi:hypothetical protein